MTHYTVSEPTPMRITRLTAATALTAAVLAFTAACGGEGDGGAGADDGGAVAPDTASSAPADPGTGTDTSAIVGEWEQIVDNGLDGMAVSGFTVGADLTVTEVWREGVKGTHAATLAPADAGAYTLTWTTTVDAGEDTTVYTLTLDDDDAATATAVSEDGQTTRYYTRVG